MTKANTSSSSFKSIKISKTEKKIERDLLLAIKTERLGSKLRENLKLRKKQIRARMSDKETTK